MAYGSHSVSSMKALTLGLTLALGFFGLGCGGEPEEEAPPPAPEVSRLQSSLARKLAAPIAIPDDTAIGGSIDALVEARATELVRVPFVNLGASGKRCTMVRFNDESGAEQMRREKCEKGSDTLRVGKVVYIDQNNDGKIDQFSDSTVAEYELFDDDHDGKLDRMIESPARLAAPIALSDFGPNVTIIGDGTIASRAREDKDHDGSFELESVTATTSFRITMPSETHESTP